MAVVRFANPQRYWKKNPLGKGSHDISLWHIYMTSQGKFGNVSKLQIQGGKWICDLQIVDIKSASAQSQYRRCSQLAPVNWVDYWHPANAVLLGSVRSDKRQFANFGGFIFTWHYLALFLAKLHLMFILAKHKSCNFYVWLRGLITHLRETPSSAILWIDLVNWDGIHWEVDLWLCFL